MALAVLIKTTLLEELGLWGESLLSSTVDEHAKIEMEHEDGPLTKPQTNKSIQWSLRGNRKGGIDVCFCFEHFLSVTHQDHWERCSSHQTSRLLICWVFLFLPFFAKDKSKNYGNFMWEGHCTSNHSQITLEAQFIRLFLPLIQPPTQYSYTDTHWTYQRIFFSQFTQKGGEITCSVYYFGYKPILKLL